MPQNVLKNIPTLCAYVQNVYKLERSASSETHFALTPMFGGCKVTFVGEPTGFQPFNCKNNYMYMYSMQL